MTEFSHESLARIEQAIPSNREKFYLSSDRLSMSFSPGERLEILADEEGFLCVDQGERSVRQMRLPDEEAAPAYFIRFISLALHGYSRDDDR